MKLEVPWVIRHVPWWHSKMNMTWSVVVLRGTNLWSSCFSRERECHESHGPEVETEEGGDVEEVGLWWAGKWLRLQVLCRLYSKPDGKAVGQVTQRYVAYISHGWLVTQTNEFLGITIIPEPKHSSSSQNVAVSDILVWFLPKFLLITSQTPF